MALNTQLRLTIVADSRKALAALGQVEAGLAGVATSATAANTRIARSSAATVKGVAATAKAAQTASTKQAAAANKAATAAKASASAQVAANQTVSKSLLTLTAQYNKFGVDVAKSLNGFVFTSWSKTATSAFRVVGAGAVTLTAQLGRLAAMAGTTVGSAFTKMGAGLSGVGAKLTGYSQKINLSNVASQGHMRVLTALPHAMLKWGKSLQWVGRILETRITFPILALTGFAAYFGFQFEKQMTRIRKVYGDFDTTTKQLDRDMALMQRGVLAISSSLGISAEEVASVGAAWAQAGAQGEALIKLTNMTAEISLLGDMDLLEAQKGILTLMSAYRLSVDEVGDALATLNVIENQTAVETSDLIDGLRIAGGTAVEAGVSIQELGGIMAALVPIAGTGNEVGTMLKSTIMRIMRPTEKAANAMRALGGNVDSLAWSSKTYTERLVAMTAGYSELSQSQKIAFARDVNGLRQGDKFIKLLGDLSDERGRYNKVLKITADQEQSNIIYTRELNTLLASSPQVLKRAWETIKNQMIQAVLPLLPILAQLLGMLSRVFIWFNNLAPGVKRTVLAVGLLLAVLGPVVGYLGTILQLGSLMFAPIIWGVKGATVAFASFSKVALAVGGYLATAIGGVLSFLGTAIAGVLGLLVGKSGLVAKLVFAFARMPLIVGGGILAAVTAMSIGILLIVRQFNNLPEGIRGSLQGIVKLFSDAWKGVVEITIAAISLLPKVFQRALMAVVRIVRSAAMAVYEMLSWMNPFARHSPSLVDQVEDGAKVIAKQYQGLAKSLGVGVKVPILGIFSSHAQDGPRGIAGFAAGGEIPTSKVGSGLKVNRVRAIVGEGSNQFPEYVIPTDPKHRGRAKELVAVAAKKVYGFAAGGILPGATAAADRLREALAGVRERERSQDRSELIQIAIELEVATGPVEDAIDRLQELDRILEELQAQINDQQRVVDDWKRSLDNASDAVKDAEGVLSDLKDVVSDLSDQLSDAQGRLDDWLSTPIEGTYAFEDALFANEMAQKSIQLQLLNLEQTFSDAGWTIQEVRDWIDDNADSMDNAQDSALGLADAFDTTGMSADDILKKINALSSEITNLRGQENDLRLAGAGSDVLGGIQSQIQVAEEARKAMAGSIGTGGSAAPPQALVDAIASIDELEDKLADLGRQGEIIDLERALALEPFEQAIQNTQRIAEQSFAAIMAGISTETATIEELESAMTAANDAVEAQEMIVNALIVTRDGLQSSYDAELEALDILKDQYDVYNDAASELRTQIESLTSAHNALIDSLGSSAGSVGGGGGADLGPAGDFATPDMTDLFGEDVDMEAFVQGLEDQLDGAFDDTDLFADIRKQVEDFKKEINATFGPIAEAFNKNWKTIALAVGVAIAVFVILTSEVAAVVAIIAALVFVGSQLANGNWEIPGLATLVGLFEKIVNNQWVQTFFDTLGELQILENFGEAISDIWDGLKFFMSAIWSLVKALAPLWTALKPMVKVLGIVLVGALAALVLGFFGVAVAVARVVGWIFKGLGWLVNWIVSKVVAPIVRAVAGFMGDFIGVFSGIFKFIWNIGKKIYDALQWLNPFASHSPSLVDRIRAFPAVVAAAFGAVVNWVKGLPGKIVSAFGNLISKLYSKGEDILQGLWNGAQSIWDSVISWVKGLPGLIVSGIGSLLSTLVSAGSDLLDGLWTGAKAAWSVMSTWVVSIPVLILTAIGDLVSTLASKGTDLIGGFLTGAVGKWVDIQLWYAGIALRVLSAIGSLLITLWQKGSDLISGLKTGATTAWTAVATWVAGIPGRFVANIGLVTSTLYSKGSEVIGGLKRGLVDAFFAITGWVASIPGKVLAGIGILTSTLYTKGRQLVDGLWTGAKAVWENISLWVGSLGRRVVTAIGALGTKLLYAGGQIIQGLWTGMKNKWESVKTWVKGLGGWVARNKGPISYDQKLLIDNGLAIMKGLQYGLETGWDAVQRQLNGYTADISGSIDVVPNTGPISPLRTGTTLSNESYGGGNVRMLTFNGDLSFPSVKNSSDVEGLITELEALAS